MSNTHRVKSWCHLFAAFNAGVKTHDLRVMDRNYQVGDTIILCEYDKQCERYTGREAVGEITYITSPEHVACAFSPSALKDGYAILSIRKVAA